VAGGQRGTFRIGQSRPAQVDDIAAIVLKVE
jgi:hypothetical protein